MQLLLESYSPIFSICYREGGVKAGKNLIFNLLHLSSMSINQVPKPYYLILQPSDW